MIPVIDTGVQKALLDRWAASYIQEAGWPEEDLPLWFGMNMQNSSANTSSFKILIL